MRVSRWAVWRLELVLSEDSDDKSERYVSLTFKRCSDALARGDTCGKMLAVGSESKARDMQICYPAEPVYVRKDGEWGAPPCRLPGGSTLGHVLDYLAGDGQWKTSDQDWSLIDVVAEAEVQVPGLDTSPSPNHEDDRRSVASVASSGTHVNSEVDESP